MKYQDEIDLYEIPPPNHSDYVMAFVPLAAWVLATYLSWDEGAWTAFFNGACCALASLLVIVLAQVLLRDPPSMLYRDAAGRIFNSPFGLWSNRDKARCAAEDAAYEYVKKIMEEEKTKNKGN